MSMAKRSNSEQLDDALEAMMTDPTRPLPAVDTKLAALLRIAGDLRDLPTDDFKARLKADLLAAARRSDALATVPAHYGKVLMTVDDYIERIDELAQRAPLLPYDLDTALRDLPDRGTRFLAPMNECAIGVSRFSGQPHWEWHGGEEMLHILDGEADVETMTDDGLVRSTLRPGSIFICPAGLWHRVLPQSSLTMFFATPNNTQGSDTLPPPLRERQAHTPARRPPGMIPHDLGDVLRDLPVLTITDSTTEEEADAAVRMIGSIGPCSLGVMRFSGQAPWERHPDGDELLHVLEGAVDLTVLTDNGATELSLDTGSVFVCPKGLWHRQRAPQSVTLLYGTPTKHGEVSFAADPRQA
jgi:quercetin dioxygenase-like cupin family protein